MQPYVLSCLFIEIIKRAARNLRPFRLRDVAQKLHQFPGYLAQWGRVIRLDVPDHEPRLSPEQRQKAAAFLEALAAGRYSPPTDNLPGPELLAYLEERGQVVRAGEVVFAAEAYREMVERIVAHLREKGTITLAQVRDMLGTSRKYAQALLAHMDEQQITRRLGDERVLRKG